MWISVDPLANKYPSWSPYNYTLNNPINLIDPDGRGPTDIIFRGTDRKEVRIPMAGEDKIINVPAALKSDRVVDLGLKNINPNNFAYGYTLSGDLQMAVGGGMNYGLETSVVNFTDNRYSGYNYVYAGGHAGASLGAQMSFAASAGISMFVAYNTDKSVDPTTFAGTTYSASLSADLKAIVGGGITLSGFSSTEKFSDPGWKGISVGVNVGGGYAVNAGSAGLQRSETVLLNDVKPTAARSTWDRLLNKTAPVESSVVKYGIDKLTK